MKRTQSHVTYLLFFIRRPSFYIQEASSGGGSNSEGHFCMKERSEPSDDAVNVIGVGNTFQVVLFQTTPLAYIKTQRTGQC